MRHFLCASLLALPVLALSQQPASAWFKTNIGVGANIGVACGGSRSILWGLYRSSDTPLSTGSWEGTPGGYGQFGGPAFPAGGYGQGCPGGACPGGGFGGNYGGAPNGQGQDPGAGGYLPGSVGPEVGPMPGATDPARYYRPAYQARPLPVNFVPYRGYGAYPAPAYGYGY